MSTSATRHSDSDNAAPRRPLLEVCVGSLEDALAAQAAGADRLELCSALELGGLTPSIGLVEQVCAAVHLPVMAMIRPRASGFCYSPGELNCMQADARRLLAAGASGIVFGLLDATGAIDPAQVAKLVAIAEARGTAKAYETIFHRAFDHVTEPESALNLLSELGVTRVLTSGGGASALESASQLRRWIDLAAGKITVMPAGGITATAAAQLVAATGCQELHIGASTGRSDSSITAPQSTALCDLTRLTAGKYRAVDPARVAAVRASINAGCK